MDFNQVQSSADSSALASAQRRFMVWVYQWMTIGLGVTGVVALLVYSNKSLLAYIDTHNGVFLGIIVLELVLVMVLSYSINKISVATAVLMFLIYSALNGFILSTVIGLYTTASVGYTLLMTALMFGIMSVYGYFTKSDLTRFGSLLFMGLIGLIIAFVINMIWFNSTVYWVISILGVFIFVGLTAYDTQTLKQIAQQSDDLTDNYRKIGVIGALRLYLDFINIFFLLLGLTGRRS